MPGWAMAADAASSADATSNKLRANARMDHGLSVGVDALGADPETMRLVEIEPGRDHQHPALRRGSKRWLADRNPDPGLGFFAIPADRIEAKPGLDRIRIDQRQVEALAR